MWLSEGSVVLHWSSGFVTAPHGADCGDYHPPGDIASDRNDLSAIFCHLNRHQSSRRHMVRLAAGRCDGFAGIHQHSRTLHGANGAAATWYGHCESDEYSRSFRIGHRQCHDSESPPGSGLHASLFRSGR